MSEANLPTYLTFSTQGDHDDRGEYGWKKIHILIPNEVSGVTECVLGLESRPGSHGWEIAGASMCSDGFPGYSPADVREWRKAGGSQECPLLRTPAAERAWREWAELAESGKAVALRA